MFFCMSQESLEVWNYVMLAVYYLRKSLDIQESNESKDVIRSLIRATGFSPIVLKFVEKYRKVSNIRRTKSQNLNASRLTL